MEKRETAENVERRMVIGTGFVGHSSHYDQMHYHFRSSVSWNELETTGAEEVGLYETFLPME